MKNIQILNSYNVWNTNKMTIILIEECYNQYGSNDPEALLNRTFKDMYIEWLLHNLGYWFTRPFIGYNFFNKLNLRFMHVDLEEHIRRK